MLINRHLKKFPILIFILAGSLFLYPQPVLSVPFISLEKEVSLGKGADKQVVQQYGIYQDKPLQLYVNRVGQKLVSNLSDKIKIRIGIFFKCLLNNITCWRSPGSGWSRCKKV